MLREYRSWYEFSVGYAPELADAALAGPVSLMTQELQEISGQPAVLLRGLVRSGRQKLAIQISLPGLEAADLLDLAKKWRLHIADIGEAKLSAVTSPLADSGFSGSLLGSATRTVLSSISPLTLSVLELTGRTARVELAVDLLAAHLPAIAEVTVPGPYGGAPLSFLSYRSHAEAFFASSREPELTRSAFAYRYESSRSSLESRVLHIINNARQEPKSLPRPARLWWDTARNNKPNFVGDFRTGKLQAPTNPEGQKGALDHSKFHQTVQASPGLSEFLASDPNFLAGRLLTTLLYLTLHTMGLTLVERYFLCYAISRSCESIFAVQADEVLAGLAR